MDRINIIYAALVFQKPNTFLRPIHRSVCFQCMCVAFHSLVASCHWQLATLPRRLREVLRTAFRSYERSSGLSCVAYRSTTASTIAAKRPLLNQPMPSPAVPSKVHKLCKVLHCSASFYSSVSFYNVLHCRSKFASPALRQPTLILQQLRSVKGSVQRTVGLWITLFAKLFKKVFN